MGTITLSRVYDKDTGGRQRRFLVERLWPRGVRRDSQRLDAWLPEVGPSSDLRKWFGHDPRRWDEFRRRYAAELDAQPAVWRPLIDAAADGDITLVYSSHDVEHNNAVALRAYLLAKMADRNGAA